MKELLKKMFTKDEIAFYLIELLKDKNNLKALKRIIKSNNEKLFSLIEVKEV